MSFSTQIDEDNEEKLKDMLSGGSVAGKADAELFVVDTKPDAKVVCGPWGVLCYLSNAPGTNAALMQTDRIYANCTTPQRQSSVRVRRLAKQLHCEKALLAHPHTKAVGKVGRACHAW